LRAVGDVAESVSSRRLVDGFPKIEELPWVSSVSFGRFAEGGPGGSNVGTPVWPYVIGDDGRMASDMVVGGSEEGVRWVGRAGDCGI